MTRFVPRSGDTSLGGGAATFPTTRWSIVVGAQDPTAEAYRGAIAELCARYWKPVYVWIRMTRKTDNDESKDLTQEFFSEILAGHAIGRYVPERGSFRAYLKGMVQLFLLRVHRDRSTLKRGGGRKPLSLEECPSDMFAVREPNPSATPEQLFDTEWARTLMDHAIEELRRELEQTGKAVYFEVFRRYDLGHAASEERTYESLARELAIKESDISNYLGACRKRIRRLIVEQIRDYVSSDDEIGPELARTFEILMGHPL